MKKLFISILFLTILITFAAAPFSAFAEQGNFLKIESESVGLYFSIYNESTDSYQMILQFYLPVDTYSLKLDNYGSNHYRIRYNGIEGYIKKNEVSESLYPDVDQPYSDTDIKLISTARIYRGEINSSTNFLPTTDDKLTYIGQITSGTGAIWYAVKRNSDTESIYFIKESDIYDPASEPDPSDNEPTEEPKSDLVKILLIIGIVIPAVIIVFLLFRPKRSRRRPPRYMDDSRRRYEDDYYDDYDDYYRG